MRFHRIESLDDLVDVLIGLGAFEEDPELIDGQRQAEYPHMHAAIQNQQAQAAMAAPVSPYVGDQVKNKTIGMRIVMFNGADLQFPAGYRWQFRNVPLFGPALEVLDAAGAVQAQLRAHDVRNVTGATTVIRAPQVPEETCAAPAPCSGY